MGGNAYWQGQGAPAGPVAVHRAASERQSYWESGGAQPEAAHWRDQAPHAPGSQPVAPYSYRKPVDNPFQPGQQAPAYLAGKDHAAAGLLAIFLGFLGVHKFYLGYNTAGFIMLGVSILGSLVSFGLAAGVMAVIAIIEGIVYLTTPQQRFLQEYVYRRREWF